MRVNIKLADYSELLKFSQLVKIIFKFHYYIDAGKEGKPGQTLKMC